MGVNMKPAGEPTVRPAVGISLFISALFTLAFCLSGEEGPSYALEKKDVLKIGGTGSAIGTMQEMAKAFRKKFPDVEFVFVPHLGTRGGIKAVLDGAIDIGLSGRSLNEAERKQGGRGFEYARSPVIF